VKDIYTAMIIGGVVLLIFNFTHIVGAYILSRYDKDSNEVDNISLISIKGYLFLYPKKSSLIESLWCLILTAAYGALMVYVVHPHTMILIFGKDNIPLAIGCSILIGFSGYSLIS